MSNMRNNRKIISKKSYEILKKENDSLMQLYNDVLKKMKKMQTEYESMYLKYIKEYKEREYNLKNNYIKYQELIQQHFRKEENNYIETIKNLKIQIEQKDKYILILQNNNSLLNDKLVKNDLIYNLKEKDLKKQILDKERLLIISSDVVNKNSKEVMNDIQKLKQEINFFKNKYHNNNMNNINRTNQIPRSLPYNNFKENMNDINNSPNETKDGFDSNQNSPCDNVFNNGNDKNINEIKKLKMRIINLLSIIKQKDKEILYLKNLNLKKNNNNNNIKRYYNTNMNMNMTQNSYKNNINHSHRNFRRCNSQSSSQLKQKKNNMNLNIIDSNINEIYRRNIN